MPSISLRPLVVEGVRPFTAPFGEHQALATDFVVELVVRLSHYSEEGLAYTPLFFITDDLNAALATVQGCDPLFIGKELGGVEAARAALRSCAPLGEGRRWALFGLVGDEGVTYGLFRPESSPLRFTSFELLRRATPGVMRASLVGLVQLRTGVVEVRSVSGQGHYFDFSGSPSEATEPGSVVRQFVTATTSSADEEVRAQLQAFYYRLGVDILTGDQGALAAVIAADAPPPAFLSDGIWLDSPLDLAPWVVRDNAVSTGEGAQALFAYAQLIRRMTMMDGITVFSADGRVRAYGCFLREAAGASVSTYVVGGARRRAYDVLRAHIGKDLVAALYRSQDGTAECATFPGAPSPTR